MKQHPYKLAGRGIAPELTGSTINVRVAETADEATSLCKDGDGSRVIALFNQQNILNQERVGKAVAEDEDTAKLVSAGNVAGALSRVQAAVDAYLSGGRAPGVPSEAKRSHTTLTGAREKFAALTPEAQARARKQLEALGITF